MRFFRCYGTDQVVRTRMSHQHGFVRISAATPVVSVADPTENVNTTLSMLRGLPDSDVVVFPELSVSAYSCSRLFHQRALLDECEAQIRRLCEQAPYPHQFIIVGSVSYTHLTLPT